MYNLPESLTNLNQEKVISIYVIFINKFLFVVTTPWDKNFKTL